ncbi:MAG: hypothetical protein AAGH79_03600 [Bacteroidota bacterium]
MPRFLLFILVLMITTVQGLAQFQQSDQQYKIGFESTTKMRPYDTGDPRVIGFENTYYAVDMEIVPLAEESSSLINSPKKGAFEVAEGMAISQVQSGTFLPNIPQGYYVHGRDYEFSDGHPVVVVVIVRKPMDIAYEITIDCYNGNVEEGILIAESLFLIE